MFYQTEPEIVSTKQLESAAMDERKSLLECLLCLKAHSSIADNHKPVMCKNKHSFCENCAKCINNCTKCHGKLEQNQVLLESITACQSQPPTSSNSDDDIPRISIDHIKLDSPRRPFASGGFAYLYGATWQNQSVALKVIRGSANDEEQLRMMMEEARFIVSLNHPNVVRVFGVVSIDNSKGIVMERADRGSLSSALDAVDKLSFDQQVSVSIDIVDGLHFVHTKRITHRDLKPENVLLFDIKSRLTAKIADFGLSKVVGASLASTMMIGTPYYMAPELIRGDRYDSKVDVYALAIVLYEVFSGRNICDAYAGTDNLSQLFVRVRGGQRPEIPTSFPTELRTVIEHGWSADADVRPTLTAFRDALCKLKAQSHPISNAGLSASRSTNADVPAVFEAQLLALEQSKAYILEISVDHLKLDSPGQPLIRGKFADLYGATWQNQSVAVKIFSGSAKYAEISLKMLEEARLIFSLNHPNVVRVFGVVSIDNSKGIVMERADRGSLSSALDAVDKLSFDQQVSVSIDVVDGLEYIHARQIIHRNMKPENVLLFDIKSRLTAKIAGFLWSKVVGASLASTTMIGTPYYMAPELFQAEARYDSKVDVYALAIVLYEVFSGRNICDAYAGITNSFQLFMRVTEGQRPEIPTSFPTELRAVIEHGWSADADVRPTLTAFRDALCKLKAQ